MAHLGAVRGTDAVKASGVALQTEFQLLNAKLAEKADLLENAEEQLWRFVAIWQGKMPDVEVNAQKWIYIYMTQSLIRLRD